MMTKISKLETIRTGWYQGDQYPVREGWYERDYSDIFTADYEKKVCLELWLQKSPGVGFWYVEEPDGEINDAYYECLPWRGLTRYAKAVGLDAACGAE